MKTAVLALLPFLLSPSLASALVAPVPIGEMPARADFVFVGEVLDRACRWDDRGVMLFTDYVVAVKERVLGEPGDPVLMSFAGGTADGKTTLVSDTPRLEVGETYLLFGLANERSSVPTVGHGQGVFRILRDSSAGRDYVVDYFGRLVEQAADGRVVRGRLVDPAARDRLAFVEPGAPEGPSAPDPDGCDAGGRIVPGRKPPAAAEKAPRGGRPMEKGAFIDYILGRAPR